MESYRLGADIGVLTDELPVPGVGALPVNAFVLQAAEPVVVDTGMPQPGQGFLDALGSLVDPGDVRWIWLTHPDRDHTGGLFELLAAAPLARVITTYLGVGIMSIDRPLPMDRLYLLNPGQSLDVGDRRLTAFRPPLYDSPATVGFYDDRSRACFTSDCFGAALPVDDVLGCRDAGDVPAEHRRAGQLLWATVDSPWVHNVDLDRYLRTLEPLRTMDPEMICSSHLPPAIGLTAEFLELLADAPAAQPFVGPDQAGLAALLAGLEPAVATGGGHGEG